MHSIRHGIVVAAWGFFDWLAVVSWTKLALVALLAMIVAGILQHPLPALSLILASVIIKFVAGG
jgi:hypothetical protein